MKRLLVGIVLLLSLWINPVFGQITGNTKVNYFVDIYGYNTVTESAIFISSVALGAVYLGSPDGDHFFSKVTRPTCLDSYNGDAGNKIFYYNSGRDLHDGTLFVQYMSQSTQMEMNMGISNSLEYGLPYYKEFKETVSGGAFNEIRFRIIAQPLLKPIEYLEPVKEGNVLNLKVGAGMRDTYINNWQYKVEGSSDWKSLNGSEGQSPFKITLSSFASSADMNAYEDGKTVYVRYITKEYCPELNRASDPVAVTMPKEAVVEPKNFAVKQPCSSQKGEFSGEIANYDFAAIDDGRGFLPINPSALDMGEYKLVITYKTDYLDKKYQIPLNKTVRIYNQPQIIASSTKSCFENGTGSITVGGSGGSGLFDYAIDGNSFQSSGTFGNLTGGVHLVRIKDKSTICERNSSVTIDTYDRLSLSAEVIPPSCSGGTGSVTLTCAGGDGTTLYAIIGSEKKAVVGGTASFTNLAPGTYSVTLGNENSCSTTFYNVFTITAPAPISVEPLVHLALCNGGASSVDVTVSGGNGGYSYSWNGNALVAVSGTSFSLNPINFTDGRTYSLSITDSKGCQASKTVNARDPDPLVLNFSTTDVYKVDPVSERIRVESCSSADGMASVKFTAAGGVGGYVLKLNGVTQNLNTVLSLSSSQSDYTFTLSDANGCTKTLVLSVLPKLTASILSSGIVHPCGNAQGSVQLSVAGGSGDYSFDPVSSSSQGSVFTIANVSSGTKSFNVSDNFCSVSNNVTFNNPVSFSASTTMDCSKEKSDIAVTGLTGGNGSYSYSLTAPGRSSSGVLQGGSSTLSSLESGTYSLAVSSAGCTSTQSGIALFNRPVIRTFEVANPQCPGSAATLKYEVAEGRSPVLSYRYSFTNQNGQPATRSENLTGLSGTRGDILLYPGSVRLSVDECAISTAEQVVSIPQLSITQIEAPTWSCQTTEKGKVSVTVLKSQHYSSYEVLLYKITGALSSLVERKQSVAGVDTYTFEVANSGDYQAEVVAGGCSAKSALVNVAPKSTMSISGVTVTDPVCYNEAGTVAIAVSNPAGALTGQGSYTVSGNVLTYTAASGARTYKVGDGYCNLTTDSKTISNPAEITFNVNLSNPPCNGNDAAVEFGSIAPSDTYRYYVNGSEYGTSTVVVPSPVNGKELLLKIRNSKGCYSNEIRRVVATPDKLIGSYTVEPVRCNGESSGSVVLGATGGTQPYSFYSVTNGAAASINGTTFGSLPAKGYSIKVVDGNGCADTQQLTVSQPDLFAFTATPQPPTCRDGSNGVITLAVSGGNGGGISYQLNSGAELLLSGSNIAGLSAGNYNIVLKDSKGCTASQTGVGIQNPAPWVWSVSTVDPTCSDNGVISIDGITGGYGEYRLASNGNPISMPIGSLSAGSYKLAVKDKNQCQQTYSVALKENRMQVSSTQKHITCFGGDDGRIEVNTTGGRISGAYSVVLTLNGTQMVGSGVNGNRSVTFDKLKAGDYTLTAADNSGCSYTGTITLHQPSLPISFTEKITEANTCQERGTVVITGVAEAQGDPAKLCYQVGSDKQVGNPVFSVTTGKHLIRITDELGCYAEKSVTVTPEPLTAIFNITQMDCSGNNNGAVEITKLTGGLGDLSVVCLPSAQKPVDSDYSSYPKRYGNLAPGSYTIYGRDKDKRCVMSIDNFTIKDVAPLELSYSNTQPTCSGRADGSAAIKVSGGNGTYRLTIGGVAVPVGDDGYITHGGLAAGSYPVLLTDKNSCPNRGEQELVMTQPDPITLKIERTEDVRCNAEGNGLIHLTAAGGNGMYTITTRKDGLPFKRDDRQNGSYLLEKLVPGSYSFDVTDIKGCPLSKNVNAAIIKEPAPLSLGVSSFKDLSCYSNGSGEITVLASGGNANARTYRINESPEGTASSFTGLAAGSYTVYVKDSKGCEAQVSHTLTQPTLLSLDKLNLKPALCFGQKGSIEPLLSGGTAPYSIGIEGVAAAAPPSRVELLKGSYTLAYSDANGCRFTRPFTITEPELLTLNNEVEMPLCFGQKGTVTLLAAGGTPQYRYEFDGVGSDNSKFSAAKGSYSARVTDSNGCSASKGVDIGEPELLTLSQSSVDPLCNGLTGSITLTGAGGTSPFTYTIGYSGSFPATGTLSAAKGGNVTFMEVKPGDSYLPAVKDRNGCTAVGRNIAIREPDLLQWGRSDVVDVKCFDDATGSVALAVKGGTLPYTYLLDGNPSATGVYGSLKAATYSAKVTDSNGCNIQSAIAVTQPARLEDNSSVVPQRCFTLCDGRIAVAPAGGVAPYTISWNKPELGSNTLLTNLCGGSYLLNIKDANGCSLSRDLSFAMPEQIVLNLGLKDTTLCKGQSIVVKPAPQRWGLLWMRDGKFLGNGSSYTVTEPGSYNVKAVDAKGCSVDFGFGVTYVSDIMNPDFLLSSKVAATDTIAVVDISNPKPAKVEWKIDPNARVVQMDGSYLFLAFDKPGTYTLGMVAHTGSCATSVEKRIEVGPREDRFEINKGLGYKESILKSFKLFPNPTDGLFKVKILLNRRSAILLQLVAVGTGAVIDNRSLDGEDSYEVEFVKPDLRQGFYLVNLIVEGRSYSIKLVKI